MTTGLDPALRRVAWDLVEAIRARGTTVVLVTHLMDEAERLCDRLALVDRGRGLGGHHPSRPAQRAGDARGRLSAPDGPQSGGGVIALRRMAWVELKLFLREPLTVVFALVLPLIILVVMSGVFGNR